MTPPNPVKSQKTGIRVLTCDTDRVLILLKGKAPQNDPYYFPDQLDYGTTSQKRMAFVSRTRAQDDFHRKSSVGLGSCLWISVFFFFGPATNPKT